MTQPTKILILGGYGAFGKKVAMRLARDPNLSVVIAGRNKETAAKTAQALSAAEGTGAEVTAQGLDAHFVTAADLSHHAIDIVINASGPFQEQNYSLARSAIKAGSHYIDLADARNFVNGIGVLDGEAKSAGVLTVSGASSVPGLSSAVVCGCLNIFEKLQKITIGISPGNRFDPGLATTRSVLSGIGKPFAGLTNGYATTRYGWQDMVREELPEIGRRLFGNVELPDLDLVPRYAPHLRTISTKAGIEVGMFHVSLWALSGLVRARILPSLAPFASILLSAKRALNVLGSDTGGMFVAFEGTNSRGQPEHHVWHMIAKSDHGPFVPAIPSVILAKRLASVEEMTRGAIPCFGLFGVAEFAREVADLDITFWWDGNRIDPAGSPVAKSKSRKQA